MSFRRISIVAFLLALFAFGVWRGEALYWWATTRVVYENGGAEEVDIMELRCRRWGQPARLYGPQRSWYRAEGTLSSEWFMARGTIRRASYWRQDGTLFCQLDESTERVGPPWLWGEKDETVRTAPWLLAGMTISEWWANLPEDSKMGP